MSAFSSAISTNSRSRIFLTTFGGRAAAGLYGPGESSTVVAGDIAGWSPGGRNAFAAAAAAAAAARMSRLVAPPVEENMGSIGWWVGSGIVPTGGGSVAPLARGERAGNRDSVWVCPMCRRTPSCRRLTQTFALCTVQYIRYLSLEQASQHYCECSVPD